MTKDRAEDRILDALQAAGRELHTEELAERVKLVRHTVSKYLQVLQAKGLVCVRQVGNAKLWRQMGRHVEVRPLTLADLPRLIEIETRLERVRRAALPKGISPEMDLQAFTQKVADRLKVGDPELSLGAELDGELVGFILGEVHLWEFGGGGSTGWINVLSVDPRRQHQGIGRRLGQDLLSRFRTRGVRRIRTLVDSYAGELIAYFRSLGFQIVNILPLELQMVTTEHGKVRNQLPKEAKKTANGRRGESRGRARSN